MTIIQRFDNDIKLLSDQIDELTRRKKAILDLQDMLRQHPDVVAAFDAVHAVHSGPTPMEEAVSKIVQ